MCSGEHLLKPRLKRLRCPPKISTTSLPRATLDPSTGDGLIEDRDEHPLPTNIDNLYTPKTPEIAVAGQVTKNKLP